MGKAILSLIPYELFLYFAILAAASLLAWLLLIVPWFSIAYSLGALDKRKDGITPDRPFVGVFFLSPLSAPIAVVILMYVFAISPPLSLLESSAGKCAEVNEGEIAGLGRRAADVRRVLSSRNYGIQPAAFGRS